MTKHMSANIEGMLRNYKGRSMEGLITDDNGKELSNSEARKFLAECQAKGWKKIPCGDCEGFDHFENGCPGHYKLEDFKPNTRYHAKHIPSGEEWVILGIKKDLSAVCAAGWPPSIAKLTDCKNFCDVGPLTDEEIKHRKKEFGENWI